MKRMCLICLGLTACLLLMAGCGTSRVVSDPEEASWQELTLPVVSAEPSTGTVMPKLDIQPEADAEDVTEDYKGLFLGTWDNADYSLTYEFRGNQNLVVTGTGGTATYTYWFTESGGRVRLNLYENGQESAVPYGFTKNGDQMTLYDVASGSAVEQLTRRVTVQESAPPTSTRTPVVSTQTSQPSPSPAPSPSVQPSPSPVPSPSVQPSPSPAPSPSVQPSPSPAPSPSVQPSPSPAPSPSAVPSASPSAGPSASPSVSPSALPSASPSVSPSASPSVSPSASPSASPGASPSVSPSASPGASPSPSRSPAPSPSTTPSPFQKLPAQVQKSVPAVECALDVVRGGERFSATDPSCFWSVMARYASRKSYPTEDGYVVLTPEELETCAKAVFANYKKLPDCPAGSTLVIHQLGEEGSDSTEESQERYLLLQGSADTLNITAADYDEDTGTLSVTLREDGNAYDYAIVLKNGAIQSITEQ